MLRVKPLFETNLTALQSEPQKGLALYLELRFRQTRLYHTFDTTHASVQECRPQRDYRSYLWSPESSHRRLPLEGNYTPSARNSTGRPVRRWPSVETGTL